MGQQEVKEVIIAKSVLQDYGGYGKDFPGKKGKVLRVIQPESPSPDFKPTRVSVRLENGPLINFRIEDIKLINNGKGVLA